MRGKKAKAKKNREPSGGWRKKCDGKYQIEKRQVDDGWKRNNEENVQLQQWKSQRETSKCSTVFDVSIVEVSLAATAPQSSV
jgi:hypothetical protein